MTQRKSSEPLQKITLNVYATDYLWLADYFPTIGPQRAIRDIVRQFRQRVEAKTSSPTVPELEVEL